VGAWQSGSASPASDEFDQSVEHEANPGEDQDAPIQAEGLMLRGGRKVRHEKKEIEQRSKKDGGKLFEQAGKHDGFLHPVSNEGPGWGIQI